jgi:hypothetical protein
MVTQGDDEVWHAFYSERAQREYYYHPKTKVVTWIVPDEMHPDRSTRSFHPPVQMDDQNHHSVADDIPRGLAFVESHQQNELNHQTRRVLSGRALTFVLLTLSTIVTGVFWALQQQSDMFPRELLGVVNKRKNRCEKQNHTLRIVQIGRSGENPNRIATDTSSDGKPPGGHEVLSDLAFAEKVLPSAALVLDVAAATPGEVEWHSYENSNIAQGVPQLDVSVEETIIMQVSKSDGANLIENEVSNVQSQEAQPCDKSTTTSPRPTRSIEVAGSHLNRRGCFIPLVHLISRTCRQAVKSRPLFDAQALVDSMMH